MNKILICISIFFISTLTKAQNAQDLIEGLKKALELNPDEKKKATIYSDLAWYYSNIKKL